MKWPGFVLGLPPLLIPPSPDLGLSGCFDTIDAPFVVELFSGN